MASHRGRVHALALTGTALLLVGCATSEGGDTSDANVDADTPVVVATTTWQGAFATAAGAQDVTVIVPGDVQHAPEYEPAASDLAAVADADFVLYSPFEPFAEQITEAAGADAETVEVDLDNSADTITSEVTRLGELFGTGEQAEEWLTGFDSERERISTDLQAQWPDGEQPVAVAQVYVTWAAQLAGIDPEQTYGPDQLSPGDVADLTGAEPQLVFENSHMSTGRVLPDSEAIQIGIANYPGEDLDLIALYEANAHTIAAALNGEETEPESGDGHGHDHGHGEDGGHGGDGEHGEEEDAEDSH
ncbi:metal ABC transporter solute-binding protein, Zn/Mn family [Nocardiopsis sp. JB363]|uniref:metal ABC transporter solute-binding protein, Zn/Mn family n=1 Tax=Nocardiopsis sp. JB363 TaxID=1434837 RepID=UPI000979D7BE|nr:zinc ABC transporter substrate-binding protein [Nocardiopsis sp. JB363]SIO89842.1 hypothetical protein BQ8420_23665 [Nocardiopsis sp. JB363]